MMMGSLKGPDLKGGDFDIVLQYTGNRHLHVRITAA